MLSINTNIPSLVAQRSLNNSTKLLNQAIERMTTGFKINHASDNAANFSITTNMNTKLSSYQVAEDNVASGLDLLSTAGGSLDLISDKLTRLRALAEQSSNGTYGDQSLKAINSEANSIVDEIERIYSTAEYNGIKLLGEPMGNFIKPVVRRDTASMTKLSSVDPTQSLTSETYSISTAEELAQLATMTTNGKVGADTEFVLADNIDLSSYSTGEGWSPIGNDKNRFTATFDGNGYVVSNLYINSQGIYNGLFGGTFNADIKNLGLENVNIHAIAGAGLIGEGYLTNVSNVYVTGEISAQGVVAGLSGGLSEDCVFTDVYSDCSLSGIDRGGIYFAGANTVNNGYSTIDGSDKADIKLVSKSELEALIEGWDNAAELALIKPISLQVGINASEFSQIDLTAGFILNVSSLRGIGQNNLDHIGKVDNLINKVSAKQTAFGAVQNRLESAAEEIATQYDNLVSSRSTLRDADIAEVSSEYIRQQILQQASATLLATANQSPSLALQLI